ncbi:MAG: helix-turn-helix domain-containing protein [Candidatus Nanopelagicales bacterium]
MPEASMVEQAPVDVGRRVRDARAARGWTLDDLAGRSGVSRRMIVNVEAATSNASIATLLRLASALRMTLAELVADGPAGRAVAVTGPAGREPLWRGPSGGSAVLVASADTPDMLELWDWTLEAGEKHESEAHRPGTRELLHVINGRLRLSVGGDVHELGAGDSASFTADVAHGYANAGRRRARFAMTVLEPIARVRP